MKKVLPYFRAVDPNPHSFYLLDPDPGGKILKTETGKEIAKNCSLFLSKFSLSSIVSYFSTVQ